MFQIVWTSIYNKVHKPEPAHPDLAGRRDQLLLARVSHLRLRPLHLIHQHSQIGSKSRPWCEKKFDICTVLAEKLEDRSRKFLVHACLTAVIFCVSCCTLDDSTLEECASCLLSSRSNMHEPPEPPNICSLSTTSSVRSYQDKNLSNVATKYIPYPYYLCSQILMEKILVRQWFDFFT